MRFVVWVWPFCVLLLLAATAADAYAVISRDDDPVIVPGSSLPGIQNHPIAEIAVFRYDSGSAAYEPIPFQIDERVDKALPSPSGTAVENMYDVEGIEDGRMDADDEIVVLFADAGPQAPGATPYPAGAAALRFEVEVTDPRAGAPVPTRWIYVFAGSGLATSPVTYVSWDLAATSSITTDFFGLDYTGNWLLTGYRVFSPCGNDLDLIDRVKGRANGNNLTEELWNSTSAYLGGILGPIRAIRYVQGAASGANTIHHDVVYRNFWTREINLRVHPIDDTRSYIDWLPQASATFYAPLVPAGVTVDGIPDTVATTYVDWNLTKTSGGGLAMAIDLPLSPFYLQREQYYVDNLLLNDGGAGYPDDDDSAYGNHGSKLVGLLDSQSDKIGMQWRLHPLCAGVGDALLGAEYRELADMPLGLSSTVETCGDGTPAADDSICDGLDNDCDGSVDEEFTPFGSTCGVGECASAGTVTCVAGDEQDSCVPGTPAPDDSVCNGLDDDCDGSVDEDFVSMTTGETCGVGQCRNNEITVCVNGVPGTECTPGDPAANDATCDGRDDDCDGMVDEDYVSQPISCGEGCPPGTTFCVDGNEIDNCAISQIPTITLAKDVGTTVVISWPAVPGASAYDVVRGDLQKLRESGGNYNPSTDSCLANDTPDLFVEDPDPIPPTSYGIFYLSRPVGCSGPGTYDSGDPGLIESRDPEINKCP